jgi:hypothetical protein
MAMPAPDAVKCLVDRFDQDRKVFQSSDYKEEQLRAEFLNPFFESLGGTSRARRCGHARIALTDGDASICSGQFV